MIKSLLLASLLFTSVAVADTTEDRYGSKDLITNKNVICFVASKEDIYKQLHTCIKSMGVYGAYVINFNGSFSYKGKLEGETVQGKIIQRTHGWVEAKNEH